MESSPCEIKSKLKVPSLRFNTSPIRAAQLKPERQEKKYKDWRRKTDPSFAEDCDYVSWNPKEYVDKYSNYQSVEQATGN